MMTHRHAPLSCALAFLLALGLAACGTGNTLGAGTLVVTGLAPDQTLLCASGDGGSPSTAIVLGSGFLSEHGTDIQIIWTATSGTPFEGGTSATTTTSGTVLSDTQVEVGVPSGFGSFEVTITVILPGGNEGTSLPQTLTIGGVLVGPFAQNDTFDGTIGNVPTTVAAPGVLANDIPVFCADETPRKPAPPAGTGAASDFVVVNPPMGFETDATPGLARTTQLGGTVVIQTDGGFSYSPPVGVTDQVDGFFYWMQEAAQGPSRAFVNLPIADRVWFLDLNHDGANTGHFDDPYQSIADFMDQQGDGVLFPGPGDTIFIYDQGDNDPYDGFLGLLDDQTLLGEGVDLTIGMRTIVPAGTRPILVNSQFAIGELPGDAVIGLGDRNTIRGLEIQAPNLHGILGIGVFGPTLIDEVHIEDSLSTAIRLTDVIGPFQVGHVEAPGVATVSIDGAGFHGIEISSGSIPVLRTGVAIDPGGPSGAVLAAVNIRITNIASTGVQAFDANVSVVNSELDNCDVGLALETFSSGTCTFVVQDTLSGVNTPHRFRGVELDPIGFGSGIDALIEDCSTISNEQALRGGNLEGGALTIAMNNNHWQNLVTGNIPAVDLEGSVEGGSTIIRQLDGDIYDGNNTGGGLRCYECTFDADPGTVGIQPVTTTSLQFGNSTGARVEDTSMQLYSCFGDFQIGTLTIWQVIGNPAGYVNTGVLTLTITTEVIDVQP